ncbi:DEAD/DEAH box helicase [Gilvimarinus agarilyticus]|uniref:ATP-dependent RNA helicase RhlE n=1 Tax=Reichenbachiella agariperforans TaxID=156994 RepID=A0A1M6R2Y3_REIAG|nr:DEAD/DEAH box helicase [Reichenbachiella agariperforans]MBU2884177.1 DEAD/DEAH box helicase [Gilvimarinus agarilyticus]MBU2912799.1 DEAD/DEAH box helicase [Reichenbachiella agariperforans]SHK26865.1 ATP-dependent RNA helicase RhlE [Reichenbachiella agariperforans]
MKFEDYNIADEIKSNLTKMGLLRPTDIQFKSIPAILKGEDVLAIAQTGTGKTAAFAIPVIERIQRSRNAKREDGIRCVVMVPTRELAIQISQAFERIAKGTKVKIFGLYGGVDQDAQIQKLSKQVDVLVSTPGRMFDLASQGYIHFNRVEQLILDEADHMLALGFIKDIQDLIKMLPKKRQTLFFSATIDEKIKKVAYSLVNKPIRIQISPKDPVSKNVEHFVAFVEMDDKRFFLERVVDENPDKKILVFVRTKVRAERVLAAMQRVDIKADTIHSGKEQSQRNTVMSDFRSGKNNLLIATDVTARGIDIPNVDYVVNYDLPEDPEFYVHRVGRTGRGKNKGQAMSFCSTEEKELLKEIETYVSKPIRVLEIDKVAYADTVELSASQERDWKSLIVNEETRPKPAKKKKKKK